MSCQETAHAKLNLALHVRRRRADGYHDLETIFAFAELGDGLSAEPGEELTLTVAGPFADDVPAGEDNLILRAARALKDSITAPIDPVRPELVEGRSRSESENPSSFDKLRANGVLGERPVGAALHLTKKLPVASGIGGGSADAAAALRILNRLWGLGLSLEALAAIGAPLGADIPACVHSRALRGEGRGDALVPVVTGFAGAPLLLVNPRVAVSTAAVFRAWDGVDRGPLADARSGRNDLETPAKSLASGIADVLAALAAQPGVTLSRMSGSGATCFALFADAAARDSAAGALSATPWWVAPTTLL